MIPKRGAKPLLAVALLLACLFVVPAAGGTIQYTISLAALREHLVHVTLELPPGAAERELQLPVWNATYQVRDFSQYVNWVEAKAANGHALTLRKQTKGRWQVRGAESGAQIEYQVFADEPGPYGAQLTAHHAFFNLAEILMYPLDARSAPVRVRFNHVPAGWKIATALPAAKGEFTAENYDRLVDSPVELGAFQEKDFEQGGGRYRIVVDADPSDYDMHDLESTIRRIVAAATSWMNDRPFREYLFIYHFPREVGGGGMEHAYSTAIDLNAAVLRSNLQALAGVTAHEFFHLWNVKRIRPQSLEPVDYSQENYTTSLWFSEGFTSTVGDYIVLRAGLADESRYLSRLAGRITGLERRPARRTQSAEESSLDTWLDKCPYYRLPNRSISYYNKGELLGVLLDLKLRDASHGRASLRDLFQWMNVNLAQRGRFFADSEGIREAAETVCHCELGDFFARYVSGTEQIPYDDFFISVGLRVKKQAIILGDPGFTATRGFGVAPVVTTLASASAAARAGLAVGDEILEINGQPSDSEFEDRLGALRPEQDLHLKVRRGNLVRELLWKLGAREELEFELKDVDNITPQQKARRAAWLHGVPEAETHP